MSPEEIGTISSSLKEVSTQRFTMYSGISEANIIELMQFTRKDPFFHTHTSDLFKGEQESGRFSSREAFNTWKVKEGGRFIYTLTNNEGGLAGIVWFGHGSLAKLLVEYDKIYPGFDSSKYDITYAIRIYGSARQQGMAIQFTHKSIQDFKYTEFYLTSPHQGIWLETDLDNEPAIKTYKSLGCTQIAENTNKGRILMTFPD